MSGHSKWSTIKHKKAAADAKRGKLFTKLIKELTVAARMGGGDPDANPRLRTAVSAARSANMPADNIKRAIQKGTGELPGTTYEEVAYEGYAPGGVAVFVETVTDNRMRTTPEIRHLFSKHGGNLAEPNSVAWMFEKQGQLGVAASQIEEERRTSSITSGIVSRVSPPARSIGLLRLQRAGTSSSMRDRISSGSGTSSRPWREQASAASTPQPPAAREHHRARAPSGSGCVASVAAHSKASSTVGARNGP